MHMYIYIYVYMYIPFGFTRDSSPIDMPLTWDFFSTKNWFINHRDFTKFDLSSVPRRLLVDDHVAEKILPLIYWELSTLW